VRRYSRVAVLSVREARARERGSLRIAEGHAGKPTSLAVVDDAGGKEVKVVGQGQSGPFAKGPLSFVGKTPGTRDRPAPPLVFVSGDCAVPS
jgi:hypothetical protein